MSDDTGGECCRRGPDPRVARRFDREWRDWDDERDFPSIVEVSAALLDQLRDATLIRPRVLEIGSGTGGVSVALLEMGARSVRGIDLSPSSVAVARRRAVAAHVEDAAEFEVAEGQSISDDAVDWVILDRVLCCDARADEMLGAAIGMARSRIALSVPESRGWRGLLNRPMWAAESIWDVARGGCRGYVHDLRHIERRMAAAGFTPVRTARRGLWHIGVYDRA